MLRLLGLTMINKQTLINYLNELFPDVGCELLYGSDYELVIAVMLSAQTTDAAVNKVTRILFNKYDSLEKLNSAPLEDIEDIIKSIGLYKNKAKNIKGITEDLINKHNGKVPSDKVALTALMGVGNKTASVVRAEYFKIPEFPVDTHVLRISKRLKLAAPKDSPDICEKKLKKAFEEKDWIRLHHQFIHFGRYFCHAKNPNCKNCKIMAFCGEKRKNI